MHFYPWFIVSVGRRLLNAISGMSNRARHDLQASEQRIHFRGIFHLYSQFKLNGKYFLWKLYFFEIVEGINQIINMKSIYLCTLPLQVTLTLFAILSLDALSRAYQLRQPNTVARRDRQVKVDMVIDFICVAVPLSTIWFMFQTPISVTEMIQVTAWPSFCLYSKTRSLLREAIRVRTENVTFQDRRLSTGSTICKEQQKEVSEWFSKAFCLYNFCMACSS